MKVIAGHWLLSQDFLDQMSVTARNWVFDQARYEAFIEVRSRQREGTELFTRTGSTANILIRGVLTAEPDFFFDILGGGNTVYGDIIAALVAADADPQIDRAVLQFDTPGGETSGFLATAQAITAFSKPVVAEVTNMAASAGFGLAAVADQIIVQDAMTMVGSIGVATTVRIDENKVEITSDDAPNKRPDVTTPEGIAAVKETLNAIHAEFAQVIASGRGTTVAKVNSDFGRGGMVIAADALRIGMIDAISTDVERGAPTGDAPSTTANTEGDPMSLEEIRLKYPELYAQIIALGVAQERDRVTAHCTAATAIGRPEMALKFIEDGTDFGSQTVQASYMTAGLNRKEADDRADDNDAGDPASGGGGKTPDGKTEGAGLDSDAPAELIWAEVARNYDIRTQSNG